MQFTWAPQQNDVFRHGQNPRGRNLLVRARAGCAKTTTIIELINRITWAAKILLCAFNKEIAEELKRRLRNARASARTLHSMGFYFVQKNLGRSVKVDDRRGRRLAQRACTEGSIDVDLITNDTVHLVARLASLGKNIAPFPTIDRLIEIAHDFDCLPEAKEDKDGNPIGPTVADIARFAKRAMDLALISDGTIDFDDMIFLPVAKKWVFAFMDLVVIDEAQDMNPTQLQLARGLCKRSGRIIVVGDDRQAIYGFRGADSMALDNLKRELQADELPLNVTYRCPKIIVEHAQNLVPDFRAAANAPEGILDRMDIGKAIELAAPSNFVLSRKNAPLSKFCLKLLRQGKRAIIRGKDISKQLAALVMRMEAETLPELAEKLRAWETQTIELLGAADASEAAIEHVTDQVETILTLAEGLAGITELLARIESLFSDDRPGSVIICSSIHKAKGLEADRVFLLEDTLYPGRGRDNPTMEEQNIEYVGITRAKHHLSLVSGLP